MKIYIKKDGTLVIDGQGDTLTTSGYDFSKVGDKKVEIRKFNIVYADSDSCLIKAR